ncbi:hypothetical protein PLESTM_002001700 [Pleodorina starrii]|nr:hypothetical protein PLESTM_002001700 [Pleodorina starrii]
MQGRNTALLHGATGSMSTCCLGTSRNQRRLLKQLTSGRRWQCNLSPGKLPRLAVMQAGHSIHSGALSGQQPVAGARQEDDKPAEPAADGFGQRARPGRPLYKVAEDPLLRQTQMLLEASRRLREQSVPLSSVDREGYYGCSSSPSGSLDAAGLRSGMRSGFNSNGGNSFREPIADAMLAQPTASAAPLPAVDSSEGASFASFGSLAAASATTAARLAAARISAVNAAAESIAAAAAAKPPTASAEANAAANAGTAASRSAMNAAAATAASVVVAAASMPPAASASASASSASAASVVSSGWLAIEEMLEEAAYSLSQELPGGQASSPLDALLSTSSSSSSSLLNSGGPGSLPSSSSLGLSADLPAGLGLGRGLAGLSESVASLPDLGRGLSSAAGVGSGLMAAVPGGDRLSEILEDLLYSLSQDINLGATQEAVAAAAMAAAAGVAGAAAELPRAAASVYRSAADAAAAAAAARASSARGSTGGGSGGMALVVPDEGLGEEYDMEPDSEWSSVYDNGAQDLSSGPINSPWDPYDTIRAAEGAAATAPDNSDAAGAAASSAAAAVAAVADGAATALPIVTASAAPTAAEAATATAAAVVEAATTAAAGTIILDTRTSPPPKPPLAAAPSAVAEAVDNDGGLYGMDLDSAQQLDELTAALQSLLAGPEGASSSAAAMSGMDAAAGAANAAVAAAGRIPPLDPDLDLDPAASASAAESALSGLTEALRRELGAAVGGASDAVDADPSVLAAAAGQAVSSALSSLSVSSLEQGQVASVDLSALPPDLRISTLLGAALQASLDLVESALGGVRSADSTLVGGVTIAAVMALLIRSLVSLAGAAVSRSREGEGPGALGLGGAEAGGAAARMRPVGVTALEAAAALNNDPQALMLDIRNGSDVSEQGLPDLRPFRRGAGAATVPLPYCDFRTTPTLANPSGSLPSPSRSSASALLAPLASGAVTVSVDPLFASKFKQLEGLDRDSRVFLLDSYGVEAPEAVLLLRSDPELERLLGAQGIKYVEGGFAGPEGWKLTGLPVMDAPLPESAEAGAGSRPAGVGLGVDMSGLLSGVAGLRLRYPSLFTRTLAVGAAGGAGVAVASSLDWGAVSRGAVGLAAAMLLTDRVLPPGVRPSGRIRQYLQAQLSESQLGAAAPSPSGGLLPPRRRVALLLRALDLAEAVGDAVVRTGGAAAGAVGSAAMDAITRRTAAASTDTDTLSTPPSMPAAAAATASDAADLETPPPPPATYTSPSAATIVLPHGMDSPQWSQAAELAVVQGQQQGGGQQQQQQQPHTAATAAAAMMAAAAAGQPQQPLQQHTRSASPLRPKVRLGGAAPAGGGGAAGGGADSNRPSVGAAAAGAALADLAASSSFSSSFSDLLPAAARAPSPSLAGRLGSALRSAADAVVRAASPSRAGNGATAAAGRAASPRGGGGSSPSPRRSPSPSPSQPDTLDLMAALATASALSHVDSGLLPGWPAVSFPRASAGQAPQPQPQQEERQDRAALALPTAPPASPAAAEGLSSSGSSSGNMWSSWRQELEEVAPPPPSLPSTSAPEGEAEADKKERRVAGVGGGSGALAASRLGGKAPQGWGGGDSAADHPAGSSGAAAPRPPAPPPSAPSPSPQRKRPLRTSSPERAAAAGAALRMMRMQMDGLDDDGLASGAYGSGGFAGRGSGGGARQKQPLRTASPERAAAAAAAMRQLRAEMGLAANDGRDRRDPTAASAAVVPRDWRRELDAAAAVPEPDESSSEEEQQEAGPTNPRGGGGGRGFRHSSSSSAAVAVVVPRPRSPRNWRDQLEGRSGSGSGVPPDWRDRVESGVSVSVSLSSSPPASSSSSPGRAKLTAVERAERDARLQDWRARV